MGSCDSISVTDTNSQLLLMIYSIVAHTIKGNEYTLKDHGIDDDKLISDILITIQEIGPKKIKEEKDFTKKLSVLEECISLEFNSIREKLNAKQNYPGLEQIDRNKNKIFEKIKELEKHCKSCLENQPPDSCEGDISELDFCTHSIELRICEMAKDLYKFRALKIPQLPSVIFNSTKLPQVDPNDEKSFSQGIIKYIGVSAFWEHDDDFPSKCSHVFFEFDPFKFHLNDYLILPYLLLHEYVAHGFSNIYHTDDRHRAKVPYGQSIFIEGWMDFVACNYLEDLLNSYNSDKLENVVLLFSKKEVKFSLAKSRKAVFSSVLTDKAQEQIKGKGIRTAGEFLHFLKHDKECKKTIREPEKIFYQLSCDLAIRADLDRDRLTTYLSKLLFPRKRRKKLSKIIKKCYKKEKFSTVKFINKIFEDAEGKDTGFIKKKPKTKFGTPYYRANRLSAD